MDSIQSGKTAIKRNKLSTPMRILLDGGHLKKSEYPAVLDFGCGLGDDVAGLEKLGFIANGWDPNYAHEVYYGDFDQIKPGIYDWIHCGYVLNVVEYYDLRLAIVEDIFDLLPRPGGKASFAVRTGRDISRSRTDKWKRHKDGWLTSINTFQHGFETVELVTLLLLGGFREIKIVSKEPLIVIGTKC